MYTDSPYKLAFRQGERAVASFTSLANPSFRHADKRKNQSRCQNRAVFRRKCLAGPTWGTSLMATALELQSKASSARFRVHRVRWLYHELANSPSRSTLSHSPLCVNASQSQKQATQPAVMRATWAYYFITATHSATECPGARLLQQIASAVRRWCNILSGESSILPSALTVDHPLGQPLVLSAFLLIVPCHNASLEPALRPQLSHCWLPETQRL